MCRNAKSILTGSSNNACSWNVTKSRLMLVCNVWLLSIRTAAQLLMSYFTRESGMDVAHFLLPLLFMMMNTQLTRSSRMSSELASRIKNENRLENESTMQANIWRWFTSSPSRFFNLLLTKQRIFIHWKWRHFGLTTIKFIIKPNYN